MTTEEQKDLGDEFVHSLADLVKAQSEMLDQYDMWVKEGTLEVSLVQALIMYGHAAAVDEADERAKDAAAVVGSEL